VSWREALRCFFTGLGIVTGAVVLDLLLNPTSRLAQIDRLREQAEADWVAARVARAAATAPSAQQDDAHEHRRPGDQERPR
jgi:hypothetical protein